MQNIQYNYHSCKYVNNYGNQNHVDWTICRINPRFDHYLHKKIQNNITVCSIARKKNHNVSKLSKHNSISKFF